jgi:hypothetical protein
LGIGNSDHGTENEGGSIPVRGEGSEQARQLLRREGEVLQERGVLLFRVREQRVAPLQPAPGRHSSFPGFSDQIFNVQLGGPRVYTMFDCP